jgi:hypothetical protein
VQELKELREVDYCPENPSEVSLSQLLVIVSGQLPINKWWCW